MRNKIKLIEPCYGSTYIRHINGLYLSMKDGIISLSKDRFLWSIESFENDRFYLGEITGHDKFEYWYGKFQTALDSGYTEQHWRLYNKDNKVIIEHADSNLFIFFSNEENLVMKDGNIDNEGYYFYFEEPSLTNGYPYIEVNSTTNKISLRFEPSILRIVNKEWLLDWANDLEKAVYSLSRLVGFMPYSRFELRTYTNCNNWGYIFYGKPVVHVNNKDMEKEVLRMRKMKKRDISFGMLHELSHLFDKWCWDFDGEATANFKLAYVLHELGYTASLNVHNDDQTFSYDNYVNLLYEEHGRLDNVKNLFCSSLTAKLVEIANVTGWDNVSKVFKTMPPIDNEPKYIRFETFINKLSEYSNLNVRAMFSDEEWDTIYNHLNDVKNYKQ